MLLRERALWLHLSTRPLTNRNVPRCAYTPTVPVHKRIVQHCHTALPTTTGEEIPEIRSIRA